MGLLDRRVVTNGKTFRCEFRVRGNLIWNQYSSNHKTLEEAKQKIKELENEDNEVWEPV